MVAISFPAVYFGAASTIIAEYIDTVSGNCI
jgi:hypothetical protein